MYRPVVSSELFLQRIYSEDWLGALFFLLCVFLCLSACRPSAAGPDADVIKSSHAKKGGIVPAPRRAGKIKEYHSVCTPPPKNVGRLIYAYDPTYEQKHNDSSVIFLTPASHRGKIKNLTRPNLQSFLLSPSSIRKKVHMMCTSLAHAMI